MTTARVRVLEATTFSNWPSRSMAASYWLNLARQRRLAAARKTCLENALVIFDRDIAAAVEKAASLARSAEAVSARCHERGEANPTETERSAAEELSRFSRQIADRAFGLLRKRCWVARAIRTMEMHGMGGKA